MWHLKAIPRVAYFYWGNDSLSFLRYLTVFSFKKQNPDWEIKLYRPKIKFQGRKTWKTMECYARFIGKNYLDRLLNMDIDVVEVDFCNLGFNNNVPETFKADFLRWILLSTRGGLWSDFDIIYFKPMKSLYFNNDTNKQINTVVCRNIYHRIGFLLSSPQNDFYKFVAQQAKRKFNPTEYQSIGSRILNINFPGIGIIENLFPHLNIFNLETDVVYPLNENTIPTVFKVNCSIIKEKSIGIHWYGGHLESEKWENCLTENNFRNYDNFLCQLIIKVMTG